MTQNQQKILEEMNYPLYLLLEGESREEMHSDDEVDESVNNDEEGEETQEAQPEDGQEEVPTDEEGNEIQPEPTEEEIFSYELQAAEDKFTQFVLYEKLIELDNKLEILQSNVQFKNEEFDLLFSEKLDQYKQYVGVLNELIFTMSTSTVYNIVGQLELEIINLLEQYVIEHNKTEEDEEEHIKNI